MQELMSLKTVTSLKDTCELRVTIPTALLPHFQEIFHNFEAMAHDLSYKARLAKQQSEVRREAHRLEVEERDRAILERIRAAYALAFDKTHVMRQAMKQVNKDFKDWWWIRQKFQKEVEAKRDLEIMRLLNQGANSKEIGLKLGIHPGTVRKILSTVRKDSL